MKIRIDLGLPIISAKLHHQTDQLKLDRVIVDTGSAGSIFRIDKVVLIGLKPETDDEVRRIIGVGGSEFVYVKQIDALTVGQFKSDAFSYRDRNHGLRV